MFVLDFKQGGEGFCYSFGHRARAVFSAPAVFLRFSFCGDGISLAYKQADPLAHNE